MSAQEKATDDVAPNTNDSEPGESLKHLLSGFEAIADGRVHAMTYSSGVRDADVWLGNMDDMAALTRAVNASDEFTVHNVYTHEEKRENERVCVDIRPL